MNLNPSYAPLNPLDNIEMTTLNSLLESLSHFAELYSDGEEDQRNPESAFLGHIDNGNGYYKASAGKVKLVTRFLKKVWTGPDVPQDVPPQPIKSLLRLEEIPNNFRRKLGFGTRVTLLIIYYVLWLLQVYFILNPYLTVPPHIKNEENTPIDLLSCLEQVHGWRGKNAACGINNELCNFDTANDYIFRCPALCDKESWTYSLMAVGNQRIKHRGYVIGGGKKMNSEDGILTAPYRVDSFLCGAAVHAGIVSPFSGGCARIRISDTGELSFPSVKGSFKYGDSISFSTFYPFSFVFKALTGSGDNKVSNCHDPRLLILVNNIILGIPIVYLASGLVTYWTMSFVGFWTICLATDPPVTVNAEDPETLSALLSIGLERFLPSFFILYVLWECSAKRTLTAPEPPTQSSNLYKLFLWYPLFWLGILNNMTFDRLPVDRLTIADLKEQAGALVSVLCIAGTIFVSAIIQAYKIWLSGRFRKYLAIYSTFILLLLVIAFLPGLTLRVHHYILAILLIPGCSTRGRTALAFQGILLGLFLSGASRWGLASIAETANSLLRGDPKGKIYSPIILGYNNETGVLDFETVDLSLLTPIDRKRNKKYNAISLLINDIERFVARSLEKINLKQIFQASSELRQSIAQALKEGKKDKNGNILIYLRLGRKILNSQIYSDFSNAAEIKWPSGEFIEPLAGST